MTTPKKDDLKADQDCMDQCIAAFKKLSRHHCEIHSSDSVAVKEGTNARHRVLQWLCSFIQEHPYL